MTVDEARAIAQNLLADILPQRWRHVVAVALKARTLATQLDDDEGRILQSTAWLHDVGYSPRIAHTGFHPLDGARFLTKIKADNRQIFMVAHHSSARAEAEEFGCVREIETMPDERTITRDLLWFCDMTVGPEGTSLSFEKRMEDVRVRYPTDHYVIRALEAGMPERVAAMRRARAWIEQNRLLDQV